MIFLTWSFWLTWSSASKIWKCGAFRHGGHPEEMMGWFCGFSWNTYWITWHSYNKPSPIWVYELGEPLYGSLCGMARAASTSGIGNCEIGKPCLSYTPHIMLSERLVVYTVFTRCFGENPMFKSIWTTCDGLTLTSQVMVCKGNHHKMTRAKTSSETSSSPSSVVRAQWLKRVPCSVGL